MHSIYVIYITFFSTNFQILDSIWVVIEQMFCMLQPTIKHLVKKVCLFFIENEPKYTGNTSVYFLLIMSVYFEKQLTGYTNIFWSLLNK